MIILKIQISQIYRQDRKSLTEDHTGGPQSTTANGTYVTKQHSNLMIL